MSRRQLLSVFSAVLLGLCLVQFQNCAPAASNSATTSNTGDVNLVDDLNKAEIQFGDNSVEVQDSVDEVVVSGLCNRNRNGSKLRWAIWDGADQNHPLIQGESECHNGQFAFKLNGLEDFVCGIPNMLVLEGEWGAAIQTKFKRRCQPLASEMLPTNADEPYGTQCVLEYSRESEIESPCLKVCYRQDKVISKDEMPNAQCAGLAASLTGQ